MESEERASARRMVGLAMVAGNGPTVEYSVPDLVDGVAHCLSGLERRHVRGGDGDALPVRGCGPAGPRGVWC